MGIAGIHEPNRFRHPIKKKKFTFEKRISALGEESTIH